MAISGKALGGTAGAIGGSFFGPAGTFLGSSIGSLLGGLFDDDDAAAKEAIENALAQYAGIVPPDLAQAIVYTQFQQGGKLTPEQLSKLPEEAQKVVLLQENPEMRQKQMAQMQAMERLAATGMGPEERYALEQSRLKAAQDAQARLKGLQQQYAQMGQAGGQAAFAAQLGALQQTSQEEAMANMQAAAMAAANRRAAIQQAAGMAGQLRAQDLGVEQTNVEAKRQRQIFDIQNAMARQQYNAQMAQQANIMNLQRQQQIQDMNIKMANEEAYRRGYLAPQQMFANQMALAQGRANVYQAQAGLAAQQAGAQAQGFSNIVSGLAQAGATLAKGNNWDWNFGGGGGGAAAPSGQFARQPGSYQQNPFGMQQNQFGLNYFNAPQPNTFGLNQQGQFGYNF